MPYDGHIACQYRCQKKWQDLKNTAKYIKLAPLGIVQILCHHLTKYDNWWQFLGGVGNKEVRGINMDKT